MKGRSRRGRVEEKEEEKGRENEVHRKEIR